VTIAPGVCPAKEPGERGEGAPHERGVFCTEAPCLEAGVSVTPIPVKIFPGNEELRELLDE
jgi:hypothetical protein